MHQIIEEFSRTQIQELHQLYQRQWWTLDRTLDETIRCVKGSSICLGVVDPQERLLGFARVLTDYMFKALVFDLIVDEASRRLGIGKRLLTAIIGHASLRDVKHIELYCLAEMESYYAAFDFSADVGGVHLMRRSQSGARTEDAE